MSDTTWTYQDGEGDSHGPVSLARLVELVRQGLLGELSRVKAGDESDWSVLRDRLPELFAAAPAAVRKGAWRDTRPHPWRRYFARMLDMVIVGLLTWQVIEVALALIAPDVEASLLAVLRQPYGMFLDAMATCAVVIPGNALMIGLTGLSIGKWVFGVKVTNRAGKPIGVGRALARELRVWMIGLGFGIPFITLITLLISIQHLGGARSTPWDKAQRNLVVHRAEGWGQTVLSVLGVTVFVAVEIALRVLALQHTVR
jgi:hypothetical protein